MNAPRAPSHPTAGMSLGGELCGVVGVLLAAWSLCPGVSGGTRSSVHLGGTSDVDLATARLHPGDTPADTSRPSQLKTSSGVDDSLEAQPRRLAARRSRNTAAGVRSSSPTSAGSSRQLAALAIQQGRKVKLQKMMFKWLFALKMLAVGLLLPLTAGLALLQSWKAVTVSLLAFGLALAVGLRSLLSGAANSSAGGTNHQHHHLHSDSWQRHEDPWSRRYSGSGAQISAYRPGYRM